eukprot:6208575-Pleurochrysis_carterae.AAC.4
MSETTKTDERKEWKVGRRSRNAGGVQEKKIEDRPNIRKRNNTYSTGMREKKERAERGMERGEQQKREREGGAGRGRKGKGQPRSGVWGVASDIARESEVSWDRERGRRRREG